MIKLEHEAERKDSDSGTDDYDSNYSNGSSNLRSVFLDKEVNGNGGINSQFSGFLGFFVLIFGIILPVIAITCATTMNVYSICGVLLRHWFESLVQGGLLLSIPAGIAFAWSRIKKNDLRRTRLVGHVIGISLGSALIVAIITSAASIMGYPTRDAAGVEHPVAMAVLSFISWAACLAAVCVGLKFRALWPTAGAKWSSSLYVLIGACISLVALGASEAKFACIRIAEKLVIAGAPDQQRHGLNFLRAADCERFMRIDCSTPKAYGLSGMFLRLDNSENKKLYFLTTGQPFRLDLKENADFAALPDEMLGKQVVGDKVSNLSMYRSLISGTVHPESLTSTIDWTFVFKNTGFDAKEARAEIGLPKDAVISEMVLWINGVPKRATIASSETAKNAYQWVVGGRRDPALITDLGKGRSLIQCFPVQAQSEVRIKISMKSSMKLDKAGEAIASLPTLLKSNFEVEGEHRVHLRSDRALILDLDNVRHMVANNGLHQVSGTLATARRSKDSIDVRVKRDANLKPVAIKDPLDSRGYITQQYVPTVSKKPDHLVVIVDGSAAVEEHKVAIAKQLSEIPASVPTSLIVASESYKDTMRFASIDDAIAAMKQIEFKGGQENLGSVIKAAELAGETEGGAVLWIHGPQPAFDKELYIIAPYLVRPQFYELSIEDSVTDVNEYFKNHQEIGPFTAVARNSTLEKDLHRFLNRWQADGVDYTLKYARTFEKPENLNQSIYVQDEISRLYVAQKVRELISRGRRWEASNLAVSYQLVTPVTSAVVLENASDYARFGMQEAPAADGSDSILARSTAPARGRTRGFQHFDNQQSTSREDVQIAWGSRGSGASFRDAFSSQGAPSGMGSGNNTFQNTGTPILQGATNGGIGPQDGDATTIMGVNTAGTVRVNSLASLEAILNIFANTAQIGGVAMGGLLILFGLMRSEMIVPGTAVGLSRRSRVIIGFALLVAGLSTPGFLNYMVASARDANLFS